MKRIMIAVAVAVIGLLAAGVVGSHEGHKDAKAKTPVGATRQGATVAPRRAPLPAAKVEKVQLIGELIDPQCWYTHNGEGKDHVACAIRCAKGGQDLAFFDERSGAVHSLIAKAHAKNPNEGMYDYVGVPVRVRGTLYTRGTNTGLLVETLERVK